MVAGESERTKYETTRYEEVKYMDYTVYLDWSKCPREASDAWTKHFNSLPNQVVGRMSHESIDDMRAKFIKDYVDRNPNAK